MKRRDFIKDAAVSALAAGVVSQTLQPKGFAMQTSSTSSALKRSGTDVRPTNERNFDMPALEKPLHIDIPVKLAEVKVAFSVPALTFEGDLPASIFHLQLIENDIADWNAKAQVIAVFHTNAGHVTLNDKAYNTERNVATGNPYKDLVSDLMKRGVHFELCGATAKIHKWGNEDVLPGIKINTDAMARMTQLVQEGFVKISE
jgi:intracellular sulfur oxidation DsrE/DsrF family protein